MKRTREEESDDEIFERRRKVHRQDKDAKDEIEDLFEEVSSENTVEERSEEMDAWGISGGAAAGILLEIFGDGTDYLHVLEHYARQNSHEQKEKQEQEIAVKAEAFSTVDREEIVGKVTEALLETVSSFPKKEIEILVANIVDDKSLVKIISESFHCLDGPENHMVVLQAMRLVSLYREKDKILAQLPKTVDKRVKTVISCAHTLKTPEEYTQLIQYVYRLQSNVCADEDREMAAEVTQKIANVSIYHTDHAEIESDGQQMEKDLEDKKASLANEQIQTGPVQQKGLLYNPWIFRMAVEVGMDISEIEIQGKETVRVLANKIAHTDMYILQSLKRRGVSYRIILKKEETVEKIAQKLEGSVQSKERLRDAIAYFIEKSAEEVSRGIERELALISEEYVKISLFKKVEEMLSVKPGRESVVGVWLDKGRLRYHKTDHKGAVISSGIAHNKEGLDLSAHMGVIAMTGKGYKLKPFMKYKNKMYIDESLLSLMEETKDLSSLLCKIVRSPLPAAENVISAEKHLPIITPLQEMLQHQVAMSVFEYAVAYKRAEAQVCQTYDYVHLKRELLEFVKSGGDPAGVAVDRYSRCEEIRSAIKETAVPHTGWLRAENEPVIENGLFRKAYRHCINKLRNQSEVAGMGALDAREKFLIFNNTTEEELLSLQTSWSLFSGIKIAMEGRVLEGAISCINSNETHIRLANGVSAVLAQKAREGLVDGQRLLFRVVEVDMQQSRVIVQEERKDEKSLLRAHAHWRVKNMPAKAANRMLKDKSFGAFVLRASATHPDSIILTIRITEHPEKCYCSHIRIKEVKEGYELEGRLFKDIESIAETYVPNYLKTLKRVMGHRKFTTEPVESIKKRLVSSKQDNIADKYALSISKTSLGSVSFVYMRSREEAAEILLHVVEKGLYFSGKVYAKPDDFVNSFKGLAH
ncbi:hypothetical protein NEMIN01_1114 [Nematocida minor]|uniref:uncharacterized protein n=1 Tax=Nematocida minor TaxID=1912983 RepID=UPI00221FCB7A|nr:uncharacterized protein NEMIN01_1114 [Nematocida minor]KAI5190576.1 hypothetical protein NEMIN01_1114 [Nematocida minor]